VPNYGLIVEGVYDTPVLQTLIRRLDPEASFTTFEAGGVATLMKNFPILLHALEHAVQGRPVDKALVIRDAGGRPFDEVDRDMFARITPREYQFRRDIELIAIPHETETWLLADSDAISVIARQYGGQQVQRVNQDLEQIVDPKALLRRVLTQAGLLYTPGTVGEIANEMELDALRYRLPAFRRFEGRILR
jgi:hypothetical protein